MVEFSQFMLPFQTAHLELLSQRSNLRIFIAFGVK